MAMRAIRDVSALLCAFGALMVLGDRGTTFVLGNQGAALAQQLDAQALGDGIELFRVRPNFYVLTGAGGNIALQVGSDGGIVVDAGDAAHAERVATELRKLATQPVRYVINTSVDPDHVGGNEVVAKAGRTILQTRNALGNAMTNEGAAAILAAEAVLLRMSAPTGETAAYPIAAWPTETFPQLRKYMYFNDEGIEVLHQPAAHTDGDSIVFFRRSDVVVAGDVIDMRRFPVIDVSRGGSINGEIAALNRLVELAIPSVPIVSREAGTVIVPGHGRLLDQTDVAEYRDVVTIVRDRIDQLRKDGKSLAEVKAANPTQGYRTRYGSDTGPWTTDMFVEAVFTSLAAAAPQQR
jgi:cyclase